MKKQAGKISIQTVNVKGHEYTRHVVDYGTLDGKRNRKTFRTEAEALAHMERNAILQKKIGRMVGKLTDTDLRDAAKAIDILDRLISLETAATFYMTHNHPTGGKVTTAEAVEKFLQSRSEKNLRAVTIGDYKAKLTPFARDMDGKPLCHITVAVLEDWLRAGKYTVGTRKAYLRATAAFFQWAVKRRYMNENPARSIDSPREDKNEVTYLTVNDAEKLLQAASEEWPDLVPYLAIGMFAGLRPSEIHGDKTDHPPLDWRKIDFEKRKIVLDAEQTKTRDGRRVDMSANLLAWLLPHRRESGPIYFTRSSLAAVVKKANVNFPKDVLRHTAGTYAYAQKQHEGEVAIMLGDTIKTVKMHYVNPMVDKADAEKFWTLAPVTEAEVMPFPSAKTA